MQDLAALTPPLLMAAVVVIAIVAFLRHEMNRSHPDKSAPSENMSVPGQHHDDLESQQQHEPDARRTTSGDS